MDSSMAVHIGLCVLPILYNFLIGHKLDITSFLCALPIVVGNSMPFSVFLSCNQRLT